MDLKTLQYRMALSTQVTLANLKGVSHEESLIQPKAQGNCFNWVLGHMVRARIQLADILGQPADREAVPS